MSRTLKALGLTMVAVFALGAMAASASATETFHSDGHHTILTAAGNNQQIFETTAGRLECATVGGSGTTNETTTHEITFSPTYSECFRVKGEEKVPTHVEMNGCDYLFTSTRVTPEATPEHAHVHIKCPEGNEIAIKATIGGFKLNCLDFPEQTPTGGGVTYDNETLTEGPPVIRDIKVTATITGITYTETGVCGSAKPNDGTYTGWVTVTGEDTEGNHTDIWWE